MSISLGLIGKLLIRLGFSEVGKKIAIKAWNWEVDRANERERKRHEKALKSANDITGK